MTNSIGMKLKLIPAGEFTMGSPEPLKELAKAFPGRDPTSLKQHFLQHKVRITKPFYVGVTEVTQEQYEKVTGKNLSTFKGTTLPVQDVSWDEAVEFCEELSAKEGQVYRLPSEAEWEYACRAGSTTRYCFGDDDSQLGEYAWFDVEKGPLPVGKKKPNAWGLNDMHGNVWEWCSDWWGEDYYAKSPADDPTGPVNGKFRVCRGGSWFGNDAGRCQSANRNEYFQPDDGFCHLGFRVVVEVQ